MKLERIAALLDGEGRVTLGATGPMECAAVASDGNNCLAMLVRNPGESVDELLMRLNESMRLAVEDLVFLDEIHS